MVGIDRETNVYYGYEDKELVVAARKITSQTDIVPDQSTIAKYKGDLYELFGYAHNSEVDRPDEFPILVKVIKKQINNKIRTIIIEIIKE